MANKLQKKTKEINAREKKREKIRKRTKKIAPGGGCEVIASRLT
jgi:hypothetical protein